MARKKPEEPVVKPKTLGVAEGFDFELGEEENEISSSLNEPAPSSPVPPYRKYQAEAEQYPIREYYTPRPSVGSRGGRMGRPPIDAIDKKIPVSITMTREEKAMYKEAARRDGSSMAEFVTRAIREYIKNHELL